MAATLLRTLVNIIKFLPILVLSTFPIALSFAIGVLFLGKTSPFLSNIIIFFVVYVFLPLTLRQAVYLFPYKFGKKRNHFLLILLMLFLFTGLMVSNTLFNEIQSETLSHCPEPYQYNWLNIVHVSAPGVLFVVLLVTFFLGILFYRYSYKQNLISELDVLYLRTFTAESDGHNSHILTRVLRHKGNIGFVLPPKSMLSTWSPYLAWFSGNIFLPFSNLPILFKESTSDWKSEMERLIKSARCIVIDITRIGEGTAWEIGAITRLGCEQKTIVLTGEHHKENAGLLNNAEKITIFSQRLTAFPKLALQQQRELERLIDSILKRQNFNEILETRYRERDKVLISLIIGGPILLYIVFFLRSYLFPSNIEQAIYFNNIEMIKEFASKGLADDLKKCGLPHLVRAYETGNHKLAEILLQSGADPDIIFRQDGLMNNEESPLTRAVINGDSGLVELLLKNGANPNIQVKGWLGSTRTPLDLAEPSYPKIAALLLEYGASNKLESE